MTHGICYQAFNNGICTCMVPLWVVLWHWLQQGSDMEIETLSSDQREQLLKRLKKFIKLTFLCSILAILSGLIGGWIMYENLSAGEAVMRIELLIPTIVATIIMVIVLKVVRGRLFSNKEEFQAAVNIFQESQIEKVNLEL